jgi:hypothetical protein
MKTKSQTTEIQSILIELLKSSNEPEHYKYLAESVGTVYNLEEIYSRPTDSIYGMLINLSRHPNGGVKFLGKGIFCSEECIIVAKAQELVVKPPVVKKPKARQPLFVHNATCGDCKFGARSHIQMLFSALVTCENSHSGKDYPSRTDMACGHFESRNYTEEKKMHDDIRNMKVIIEGINQAMAKKRTARDKENA